MNDLETAMISYGIDQLDEYKSNRKESQGYIGNLRGEITAAVTDKNDYWSLILFD